MTDILPTFAWAFVNGDGFVLTDIESGRQYVYGSEEEADAAYRAMEEDEFKADMHVALIALVPVSDNVMDIEEIIDG